MTNIRHTKQLVETKKIGKESYSFLKEQGYTKDSVYDKGKHEDLKNKLLVIGGEAVVLLREVDEEDILNRGEVFINPQIKMVSERTFECHRKSARIWSKNPHSRKLYTGYGLSKDGIWRQHSWVMKGLKLIEPTEEKVAYYGYRFTDEEAEGFYICNTKKPDKKIVKRHAERLNVLPDFLLWELQMNEKFLPNYNPQLELEWF